MCVTAVAGVAGHQLRSDWKHSGTWKVRVDLSDQHDHLARHVLPRVDIILLRSAAMAIGAIHGQRVAELTHEGIRTMHWRVRGQKLQADTGPLREWPVAE